MTPKRSTMDKRKALSADVAKRFDPKVDRARNLEPLCGAKKRNGEICRARAGYGTTHLGVGRCKHHGGSLPAHVAKAAREQALFMGAPKDINPVDAIMWCIRIAAGEVEWMTNRMHEIDQSEWYEFTPLGKQLHVLARERAAAQERLVKFSKDALQMGLAERSVRLAEMYGNSIAQLLRGIESQLEFTPKQKAIWPQVVRTALAQMGRASTNGIAIGEHIEDGEFEEIA